MLKYLKNYNQYIEIIGFKEAAFDKAEAFLKANRKQKEQPTVQFFDADLVATEEHLFFATVNALEAIKNKTNRSKTLAVEIMLYASAQYQIQRAIDFIGIKPLTKHMAAVVVGSDPKEIENSVLAISQCVGSMPDESVLELTSQKEKKIKQAYKITNQELQATGDKDALVNLVVERVALLSTKF